MVPTLRHRCGLRVRGHCRQAESPDQLRNHFGEPMKHREKQLAHRVAKSHRWLATCSPPGGRGFPLSAIHEALRTSLRSADNVALAPSHHKVPSKTQSEIRLRHHWDESFPTLPFQPYRHSAANRCVINRVEKTAATDHQHRAVPKEYWPPCDEGLL